MIRKILLKICLIKGFASEGFEKNREGGGESEREGDFSFSPHFGVQYSKSKSSSCEPWWLKPCPCYKWVQFAHSTIRTRWRRLFNSISVSVRQKIFNLYLTYLDTLSSKQIWSDSDTGLTCLVRKLRETVVKSYRIC